MSYLVEKRDGWVSLYKAHSVLVFFLDGSQNADELFSRRGLVHVNSLFLKKYQTPSRELIINDS